MGLSHEFGIIIDIQDHAYESYTPEKYHCISLHDDIISDIMEALTLMPTYFHRLELPNFGLAYHGITIIPPVSLPLFLDMVLQSDAWKRYEELDELAVKIKEAIRLQRYMIHYGI